MRKFYKKTTPKYKQITLNQIYGVPTNEKTTEQRKAIRCDDKEFIESLQEIGRIQKRR